MSPALQVTLPLSRSLASKLLQHTHSQLKIQISHLDFYFAYGKIEHDKSHGHIKTMNNLSNQSKIFLWAKKVFNFAAVVFMLTILGNQFGASDVFANPNPNSLRGH